MVKFLLTIFVWLLILMSYTTICVDISHNWVVRGVAHNWYDSGMSALSQNDIDGAITSLLSSFNAFPSYLACEKLGWIYENLGQFNDSLSWYTQCLSLDASQISIEIRVGISHYQKRDYTTALLHMNNALALQDDNVDALFHKGVILQNMGDIQGAANIYFQGTEANPLEVKSTINLAALHHKYGSVNDALYFYNLAWSRVQVFMNAAAKSGRRHLNRHYLMVKSNLAAAYLQLGALSKAYVEITELLDLLMLEDAEFCSQQHLLPAATESRSVSCNEVSRTISSSLGVQMIIQRTSARWNRWETTVNRVLSDTLHNIAAGLDFEGPLLPFDTLLTVMSLEDRLIIAKAASALITRGRQEYRHSSLMPTAKQHGRKLRVGFMSFDFNNHPTAHLVEGIFSIIQKHRAAAKNKLTMRHNRFDHVELFIYSYGKDDNSTYRRQLVSLADHFVELSHLSHREAADRILSDRVDILLDMQLHTLGHRLEISAHRPAPVQINYLVYPGTSGAPFFNYIIADHIVTPAEHASHYSESLLLFPVTYQVSFFDRLTHHVDPTTVGMSIMERRTYLRRFHSLPDGPNDIIFCNFNKIDKIDPQSFALWMSILRRVPHSYLWLLEPVETSPLDKNELDDLLQQNSRAASQQNNIVRQNLIANAVALGVKESQLLFAPRTDKAGHIFRHAAADLFLDTLVYGAHSTATDALRGGLPVLTVLGDTFPSRVAPSLYASLAGLSTSGDTLLNTLVVHSLREFEDLAVKLTSSRRSLGSLLKLKKCLSDVVENSRGLFDTVSAVDNFVRGMMAVQETKYVQSIQRSKESGDYHIIVTNKIHDA